MAHAHGLIHRDLKPGNILIGAHGPILTDFGIAHEIDDTTSTTLDDLTGTPNYMAPEQIERNWRNYGPWTDFYALGCLAYWCCVGQTPFRGVSVSDIFDQHMAAVPPQVVPTFEHPAQLADWIHWCMQKRIHERPQLAADAARTILYFNVDRMKPAVSKKPSEIDTHLLDNTLITPSEFDLKETQLINLTEYRQPKIKFPETWNSRQSIHSTTTLPDVGHGLAVLRQPALVGRESEREALWSKLRLACEGRLQVVVIEGASGIGKTALMQWLARKLTSLGGSSTPDDP